MTVAVVETRAGPRCMQPIRNGNLLLSFYFSFNSSNHLGSRSSIWSRTRRNACNCSSVLPSTAAGSSNGQMSRSPIPGNSFRTVPFCARKDDRVDAVRVQPGAVNMEPVAHKLS